MKVQALEHGSESTDQAATSDSGDGTFVEQQETLLFYRSVLAELPLIFVTIGLGVLALVLTLRYAESVQVLELLQLGDSSLSIGIPLFGIVPILSAALVIHRLYDRRYVIASDYVRSVSGLLSMRKQDMRIAFQDVRGVEVDRSLYQRIVNVGDMPSGSAMQAGVEVQFLGVRNPSRYRDIILSRRKELERHTIRCMHNRVKGDD